MPLIVKPFGLGPAAHHYTNLLLLEVNVVLPFSLITAIKRLNVAQPDGGGSCALHPVNVEFLVWVPSGRMFCSRILNNNEMDGMLTPRYGEVKVS